LAKAIDQTARRNIAAGFGIDPGTGPVGGFAHLILLIAGFHFEQENN
jgi:hypothetical protein